ncbi:P-loop NTPase fold protein [uncultured Tateyamaria sp.]|uniref:KAP family P-loop NTPase fold protein n=1 Tax=uncultured Tateyamaria sp. TaxID=455651 RepID=UPI002603F341|nr:P-loop NTPase fold protein [uncultured Tateyamaria sp.]
MTDSADLLGFDELAQTYTNLITSLDDSRTISIEAGFGRGRTHFRKQWADLLRGQGELVFEIDAQRSDHSGDPVVTFLGALVGGLPKSQEAQAATVFKAAKRVGATALRSTARAVLKSGAEELIEMAEEGLNGQIEGFDALQSAVNDLGDGMSKQAAALIGTQLAAEQVREKELPDQLNALHAALTDGCDSDRVIIFIDELDRCHPDYAIALLEAMKLVFDHPGFIFVLFVNADYLENLAAHRFGGFREGEKYLDKFVDIRLGLPVSDEQLSAAVEQLALELPLAIPFGDHQEFSVERAANLAGEIAPTSGLSMRQIKAVLLKAELACRCYGNEPLDLPLLVAMAFVSASPTENKVTLKAFASKLPRVSLTPTRCSKLLERAVPRPSEWQQVFDMNEIQQLLQNELTEMCHLHASMIAPQENRYESRSHRVPKYLAPHYIPDHEAKLDAVYKMQAGTEKDV